MLVRNESNSRAFIGLKNEEIPNFLIEALQKNNVYCLQCDRMFYQWEAEDCGPCNCETRWISLKFLQDSGVGINMNTGKIECGREACSTPKPKNIPPLVVDSGDKFLGVLDEIAAEDAAGLKKAAESYGHSWKARGGVGAFMMLARKWDRMQNRVERCCWDVFDAIRTDDRGEGVIDDVRDLRRYLMLVEAEMRARGFKRRHRDN